jgi:hypothetical protein
MKFLTTLLLLINISAAEEKAPLSKEDKILNLITTEINQIKGVRNPGDKLEYRVFELESEKIKLIRAKENRAFLKVKDSANKDQHFKNSTGLYSNAQKLGYDLIKKYPKTPFLSEIYFTLASNTMEVLNNIERDQKEILTNLHHSYNHSRDKYSRYKAEVKLAEVYYTIQKFDDAIKFYKNVIVNKTDPWYTKNLYNYAWCLFQKKEYRKAINLSLEAYELSSNAKYIDFREQLDDALSYFYVFNKEPRVAIDFHEKNQKKPKKQFLKVVNLSQKYISSDAAIDAEQMARGYCSKRMDYDCLYPLSDFKLGIFKESKDYSAHYQTVIDAHKEFSALDAKLKADTQDITLNIVENLSLISQLFVELAYKNYYPIENSLDKSYKRTISYFDYLKIFNPPMHHEYAFLQAELSYKEEKFDKAAPYYLEAHAKTPKEKFATFYPKLFKSMIDLANNKSHQDKKFFEKTYVYYLQFLPNDKSSEVIYKDLFNFYILEKDVKKASALLDGYVASMPANLKIQQEMAKVVLNEHIKAKDATILIEWINKLKLGFLKFEKSFIDENVLILGGILFNDIKKFEDKKMYKEAIVEYKKLFDSPQYPAEIKNDCAFNMSINYLKLKNTKESYDWLKVAINRYPKPETIKRIEIIRSMGLEYGALQDLAYSAVVSQYLLNNLCTSLKSVNPDWYQLQTVYLALGSERKFEENLNFKACPIEDKVMTQTEKDYLDYFFEKKDYAQVISLVKTRSYEEHHSYVFNKFYEHYWDSSYESSFFVKNKELSAHFSKFVNGNMLLTIKEQNKLAELKKLEGFYDRVMKTQFGIAPMEVFNLDVLTKSLSEESEKLMQLKAAAQEMLSQSQSPQVYISVLAIEHYAFRNFRAVIDQAKYPIADVELRRDIENNMIQISQSLAREMKDFERLYRKTIEATPVVSYYTKYFNYNPELFKVSSYQYEAVVPKVGGAK